MEKLAEFVSQHMSDDTARLIMNRKRWPDIDMDMAVNCIESRRKLKGKVQEWHDNPGLVFPLKLSAEQCSSSATGRYKADMAEHMAGPAAGWSVADLTGGLGVDCWFFSMKAGKVIYNEMQTPLCEAARHNFKTLGAGNISVVNEIAEPGNIGNILGETVPNIVYMDPARRGEGGRKVFLIEECTPDVLTLKEEIFTYTRHMLIKLSPMADISMVCSRLGSSCREVHVVASGGECKELLIWMDREWQEGYTITAVEIHNDGRVSGFTFSPSEEKAAKPLHGSGKMPIADFCRQGCYLFEPGKALMKAGAFNLISERFGIGKLGVSTHYYIIENEDKAKELSHHGKIFRIIRCSPLDKRSIKAAGNDFPKAEVTARNIPMDTDTLRKKLGTSSGDDIHIFGLKSDKEGNLLFVTSRS